MQRRPRPHVGQQHAEHSLSRRRWSQGPRSGTAHSWGLAGGRCVKHPTHAAHHALDRLEITYVPRYQFEPTVTVVRLAQCVLFALIAREDSNFLYVRLGEQTSHDRPTETARAARDQDYARECHRPTEPIETPHTVQSKSYGISKRPFRVLG